MKKNIKNIISGVCLVFVASASAVDVAGILETGNAEVVVDSVNWFININPAPITESTPGWGGAAGLTDTIQFEAKAAWPDWARLFYRVNGIPGNHIINPLLPDTWYDLPAYDFQGTKVRFEDTVLVGLSAPNPEFTPERVQITPNPVTGLRLNITGLPTNTPLTINFYNIAGGIAGSFSVTTGKNQTAIDLNRMARGVYLVRIHGRNVTYQEKVLLLH